MRSQFLHEASTPLLMQQEHVEELNMDTKPDVWRAVEVGDESRVYQLLKSGSNLEERYRGWTPLMKAAEDNRLSIVQMLLIMGANINAVNKKGRSALSFAAAPSQRRETASAVLRHLLAWGADASLLDTSCCTARIRAWKEGRREALAIFDEFGV